MSHMTTENQMVITAEGFNRIEQELEHLRTVRRREIAERIKESKQFGELSENSEYEDAKNEQAFVEGRIIDLKHVLQNVQILEDGDVTTDVVGIGSKVKVRDLDTKDEWVYTIVGSFEADPAEDRISNESPVGEALMDKKVGEKLSVDTPAGEMHLKIVKITK
jgi:transcription elongation factor GreA